MDGLLIVSTTRRLKKDVPPVTPVPPKSPVSTSPAQPIVESSEDALAILQSQPSRDTLLNCLVWLTKRFNICSPSPQAAQLVYSIVNDVIPTFWASLQGSNGDSKLRKMLLQCITSLAGLGAVTARLRDLIAAQKEDGGGAVEGSNISNVQSGSLLGECLHLIQLVLHGETIIKLLWAQITEEKPIQRTVLWKELVALLATGRVLSLAAEGAVLYRRASKSLDDFWIEDGKLYSTWLGRNINAMDSTTPDEVKAKAQLVSKALSMSYVDSLIENVFPGLLTDKEDNIADGKLLWDQLSPPQHRTIIFRMLQMHSSLMNRHGRKAPHINRLAALLVKHAVDTPAVWHILVEWVTKTVSGASGVEFGVHRAVIAALPMEPELLDQVLFRLLEQFGDVLHIRHLPILSQEVFTKDLLLIIGRYHRIKPAVIVQMARSSTYINAISNRLSASSSRARFLGMTVGMAVSSLIDAPDKRMKFEIDELEDEDRKFYSSLVHLKDDVGSIKDLPLVTEGKNTRSQDPTTPSKKIPIDKIEDFSSESSTEEELPTFAKPDSDLEDEDEDPTLINRHKPTAPVYIRDLLHGLKDSENFDRQRLALSTAASLIRRKARFGTEVQDHIAELAADLVGLKDSYDMENFQRMRMQAMIAVIIAQPLHMSQWFSNALFSSDYSMGQRISILTAIGMAARELAGYGKEDSSLTDAQTNPKDLFPSKTLPAKMDSIYGIDAAPVDILIQRLEQTMIEPIAAEAADKMAGPNALKIRTFSSRMEVEKKRQRPIRNELAKIVADGLVIPLMEHYRWRVMEDGSRSSYANPTFQTHLLKTLAIVLNAAGPSTLVLPSLTTKFWAFLFTFQTAARKDSAALEAVLFSLLTILELNANDQRRIAQENSKELLETQAWAENVLENTAGGSALEDRIKMLAAGVIVRAKEVVDKYQRLLLGELVDFV